MDNQKQLDDIQSSVHTIEKREQFWHKYVFQIITIVFVAGGLWANSLNVEALAEDNRKEITHVKVEAQNKELILTDRLARLENTTDTLKKGQEAQQKLLEEILKELRNQ